MAGMLPTDVDREALDLLLRGFAISRMLRLVCDIQLADKIPTDGAVSVQELATSCAVLPLPLLRILRALAAFGIFQITIDGTVTHTPRSLLLRTGTPNSMHHAARFWTSRGSWGAWERLDVALTGGVPHEAAWGMGRFDYLRQHPDEARVFDAMMANFPDSRHAAIVSAHDFSTARLIIDVGGGNGASLRHILAAFPGPRGLVFDREDVVQAIRPEDLMGGRITTEAGSFFDRIPSGADIYLLVRVLHDWSDHDCVRILQNCRAAIPADGVLLVGEQILEPDPARGRPAGYLIDTQMMAMFGSARERTESEFSDLLEQSGFSMRRVIARRRPIAFIEAAPIGAARF